MGQEQKFDLERYRREAADQDFIDGERALNEERDEEALELLERAWRNGNVMAGVLLGESYYSGTHCERDYERAISLFREGLEKGCPLGVCWLAECYTYGYGMPKDEKKAQEVYDDWREALWEMTQAGSVDAQFAYGYDLVNDRYPAPKWPEGFDPHKEGFRFLTLAMEHGIASAGAALAGAYLNGWGCEPDTEKALEILDRFAGMKNKNVNFWIGFTYYYELGREQDLEKARDHFLLAAGRGDDAAMCCLGDLYADDAGLEKDIPQAIEWYEKAAKENNPYAQERLALLYYYGDDVWQDLKKAVEYFQNAAEESEQSAYMLARILLFEEEYQDRKKGFRYLEMAAKKGKFQAQELLARCYLGRYGFEKDAEKAEYWSLRAGDQESEL